MLIPQYSKLEGCTTFSCNAIASIIQQCHHQHNSIAILRHGQVASAATSCHGHVALAVTSHHNQHHIGNTIVSRTW
jgi:DeoR/GlpR family transcriptional regulator of sugar metabolism